MPSRQTKAKRRADIEAKWYSEGVRRGKEDRALGRVSEIALDVAAHGKNAFGQGYRVGLNWSDKK
jgi:hypothetical protein